jgi:hypothetical protein
MFVAMFMIQRMGILAKTSLLGPLLKIFQALGPALFVGPLRTILAQKIKS